MRAGTQLHLTCANKEELVRDLNAGESLDGSDHEMEGFRILTGGSQH